MNIIEYGALTESYGGIESYIKNQVDEFSDKDIHIDFLVPNENGKLAYEDYLKDKGCVIYRAYRRWHKSFIGHYVDLCKFFYLHASEYDIAVANYLDYQNINYLIVAKLFGLKTIAHSHQSGQSRNWKKNLLVSINRFISNIFVDYLLACSYEAGQWMYGKLWKDWYGLKASVINNGIDVKKFSYKEDIRKEYRKKMNIENKVVFGHVGRLAPQKNQIFLIDVFKEIHEQNNEAILLLVGEGILRKEIESRIKELGCKNSVFLLGERLDIAELLQAMDYFIFPSEWEGLGISLIEAQCSGLKCFASDKIPKEAFITDNIVSISLLLDSKNWANTIFENMPYDRKDESAQIIKANYDEKSAFNKIKEVFCTLCSNQKI